MIRNVLLVLLWVISLRQKNRFSLDLNLWVFLLLFFIFLLFLSFHQSYLLWDENVYLSNARSQLGHSYYSEDFRFPLLSFLIASLWRVTGESLLVAKVVVVLLSVFSVLFVFLASRNFLSKSYSVLVSLLFALHPLTLFWADKIYTDFPGLFFLSVAFFLLSGKSSFSSLPSFFLIGFFSALGFLTRFTYILFFVSVVLILLYRSVLERSFLKSLNLALSFLIGFLVVLFPWLVYNRLEHGSFFWNLVQQYTVAGSSQAIEPFIVQFFNILEYFHLLFIFAIVGIYFAFKKRNISLSFVSVYSSLTLFYLFFFVHSKSSRYLVAVIPFVLMLAFYGLYFSFVDTTVRNVFLVLFFLVTLVSSFFLLVHVLSLDSCRSDGSVVSSIAYVGSHTVPGASVVSNFWRFFAYYYVLHSSSMYSSSVDRFFSRHHAKYVIYHSGVGDPFDLEKLDSWSRAEKVVEFSDSCDGTAYIYKVS